MYPRANNKTVPDDYSLTSSAIGFSMPYRIGRIRDMLEAKDKLSVADFQAMQSDRKSKLVELTLENLLPPSKKEVSKAIHELTSLDLLRRWDGKMESWKALQQPSLKHSLST